MNDDDFLKDSLFKKNPLHESVKERELSKEFTKNHFSLSDIAEKALSDFSNKDVNYAYSSLLVPDKYDYSKALDEINRIKIEKDAEELRRHNEISEIGRKQIQNLESMIESLEKLVKDSGNAIEQRDAIIHFFVQTMLAMESSKEEKKKSLTEVLTRVASIMTTGSDLVVVTKSIAVAIEELSKES